MNVIEAYTKFKGQLIILVSGLSGCGKTTLAKKIKQDFNIKFVDQFYHLKQDYDTKVTLPDGSEVVNWDSDDAINWDSLNKAVDSAKEQGVVVAGIALPTEKLTFTPDYHIHLSIPKKLCVEKRKKYLEKNKDKYPIEFSKIDSTEEKLTMNRLTFPYYIEAQKRATINKFINAVNMDDDEIYDEVFEILIEFIENWLYNEYQKKQGHNQGQDSLDIRQDSPRDSGHGSYNRMDKGHGKDDDSSCNDSSSSGTYESPDGVYEIDSIRHGLRYGMDINES